MDILRWSAPPLPALGGRSRTPQISNLGAMRAHHLRGNIAVNVECVSVVGDFLLVGFWLVVSLKSSSNTDNVDAEVKDQKSETYSNDMTKAMGAVLTYRHELGMNYNFIYPGLIVGSCLQTPLDVDKLRKIGVRTIFCLQQDPDLEYPNCYILCLRKLYFGVDIGAIREYAIACGDIEHIRAEIRDFDAFDLRMRLPAVVSKLYKAIKRNRGVTYVHCTAGLGRAPGVADMLVHVLLAYMFWIEGYKLNEGHQLLQSRRACFPKLDAIKNATVDMLTGLSKSPVTLMWKDGGCSSVEISGLDIGWGQNPSMLSPDKILAEAIAIANITLPSSRSPTSYPPACSSLIVSSQISFAIESFLLFQKIPLKFNKDQGAWILEKELPEGRYEYKYIVDGEWMCNEHELLTFPNSDGQVNNYVEIINRDMSTEAMNLTTHLRSKDADLTKDERQMIRELFEHFNN
ncbi:hypothetical protein ZIOFF_065624 [Zingiber officinale]|uniref:AMP-activated protein kinase glycogen-binding domain-containing protein n=1 Tax=Zingiber officinale TaxID=94328 RepID=A0A8J5K771_ZINOF|nr:hypothetical protein ZIOFF_065624 [Zingiber officinale]